MPDADDMPSPCRVIVAVDRSPALIDELTEHARIGIRRFPECAGSRRGALDLSSDGGRLVQTLEWDSEVAYQSCRDDPKRDELPSTKRFMEASQSGAATLDVRTFALAETNV